MEFEKLEKIFNYLHKSKIKAGEGLESGLYPFYTSSNIQDKFVNEYIYDDECIIMGTGGSASLNYYCGKFATSTDNYIVKTSKQFLTKYIYYYLKFNMHLLENGFKGAGLKHISKEYINNIEIPVIDIEKQKELIYILDKIEESILIKEKQREDCEIIIKSQFDKMFGNPITNPKSWEVKKLKELSTDIMSGNTPKGGSEVYVDEGIMFFRSQNVWRNKLELNDIAYIDMPTHIKMKKSSLKHNDLLITKTGRINTENSSLGRTALYTGEDDKANINGHVYLVRLKENIQHKFVLQILISNQFREYMRSVCVGGIDKRQLNKDHIEDFPIIFPPEDMQEQFIEFVEKIENYKSIIEYDLDKLKSMEISIINKFF